MGTHHRIKAVNSVKIVTRPQQGASVVEFALVLPLLLILVFGIIEASWAFAQQNDVRHGAREGARAAAVNVGDSNSVGTLVCDRMDVVNPSEGITVSITPLSDDGATGGLGKIRVDANLQTLTGFFPGLFGGTVSSEVEFRTEQPADADPDWWGPKDVPQVYACP